MSDGDAKPMPVVLAPDLVGAGLVDSSCGQVLENWRDGRLQPVVCRSLLVRYFRLLRGLGVTEVLIRRWGWWFSSREHALFLPGDVSANSNGAVLCEELARLGGAETIIHSGRWPHPQAAQKGDAVTWTVAEAFLKHQARTTHHGGGQSAQRASSRDR